METSAESLLGPINLERDFEYLISFLPPQWEEQARESGALRRCRKIADAKVLLRALLLHLAEGISLRETATRLREGGILDISDVAIMDRLRSAGPWFSWMNQRLMDQWVAPLPRWPGKWSSVCLADGTRIQEPGPTGSGWMVHYAVELSSMRCREVLIYDWAQSGEGFRRFKVRTGELWIGDRAYGKRPGIAYAVERGADVITRFALNSLPMQDATGSRPFLLLDYLRKLSGRRVGDWPVRLVNGQDQIQGRVCAVRKSAAAAAKSITRARETAIKNQDQVQPETLEAAQYVFVFTTLSPAQLSASNVLEVYRGRWQIELVFKRLKSVLSFGHLPKYDPDSIRSWIEGKLLVALLLEALLVKGESFFPWGFPLQQDVPQSSVPVA